MSIRPSFFIIVKISAPSSHKKRLNIFVPIPLFAIYSLIDSLDDLAKITKLVKPNTVTRTISSCSTALRVILCHLMLAGKLDLVDIEANDDKDKVNVKILLR